MKQIVRVLLVAVVFIGVNAVVHANEVSEDPVERHMLEIAKKLRCAVCQNQPVSESHSGLASDMRGLIREQLKAGKSDQEIIDYFVARYGDYVLMKPRRQGIGLPLWLIPPVLLIIAALFGVMFMRSRVKRQTENVNELSEEDRERVRKARQKDKENNIDKKD